MDVAADDASTQRQQPQHTTSRDWATAGALSPAAGLRRRTGDSAAATLSSRVSGTPRMPKLQLFDLVAGGAFERALEGMGRQEGGQVCFTTNSA